MKKHTDTNITVLLKEEEEPVYIAGDKFITVDGEVFILTVFLPNNVAIVNLVNGKSFWMVSSSINNQIHHSEVMKLFGSNNPFSLLSKVEITCTP